MTTIATRAGQVVMSGGQVCTDCCDGEAASCDCAATLAWSDPSLLTFDIDGFLFDLCMSDDIDGLLTKEAGGGCNYSASYDLEPQLGQPCTVKVVFTITDTTACDGYTVASWEVTSGGCTVLDVTMGAAC